MPMNGIYFAPAISQGEADVRYILSTILSSTTDGSAGADAVAMTPITETGLADSVQEVIEALITRLKAVADGASGGDLIGLTAIAGITGGTVQAVLESFKTYCDQLVGAANAVVYTGDIDCSEYPNYPAADKGHLYLVSVAGKIGGASGLSVYAGDWAICRVDSTASGNQAAVGANWTVINRYLDAASESVAGIVELATQAEVHTGTDAVRAVTPATLAGEKNVASGIASLDGSSKVVQNPANATATPTASKIPIADGSGKLDGWVTAPSGNLPGVTRHLRVDIHYPLAVQTLDNEICLVPKLDAAITITNLEVTLDATTNQVAGDLKYADTFVGLANPVVINDFDTTSGVRSDSSITSGAVAAGKCIYLSFDSAPHADITQMIVDISYDYD